MYRGKQIKKMGGSEEQQHIVMLPALAQGHLIPFLALANQIIKRFGFTITITTTPLNVRYLRTAIAKNSTIPPTQTSRIHLFELPFNSCGHGLPPNTENAEDLPMNQIINLFQSSTSLEVPFRGLIQDISVRDGSPPLCIISDIFMGWANEVAKSCGTVNVTFTTAGAFGTAAYVSLWQHLRTKKDEFNLPGFPDSCTFHTTQVHHFLRSADGADSWSRFFQPQIGYSLNLFGWLCNTGEEIEPTLGIGCFKEIIGWPLAAEQGYNAKLLVEEMGVCVEITRGVQSSISRDDVKKVIETVIGGGNKAEEMKNKAAEIRELIRAALSEEASHKGSSLKAMDDFMSALLSNKQGIA